MKSYSNLFILPALLVISLTLFSGFTHGSNLSIVEDLMRERSIILQQAYYGQIDLAETEARLFEIETQPLLESDIIILRRADESSMDQVKDLAVLSVMQMTKLYNYLSFHVEIIWYMKGLEGDYTEEVNYGIIMKDCGDAYKLSELYPLSENEN